MKDVKRILSLILSATMVVSLIPIQSFADIETNSDNEENAKVLENVAVKTLSEGESESGATAAEIEAARNVEVYIDRIGKVDLTSGGSINTAENQYNNLSENAKKEVRNYDILVAARKEYDELMAVEIEKTKPVIELIKAIGTVDLNSYEKIEAAEKAYYKLSPQAQEIINSDLNKPISRIRDEYKKLVRENHFDSVVINEENFPDNTFRAYMLEKFNKKEGDTLTSEEAFQKNITSVELNFETDNYKGFEYLADVLNQNEYTCNFFKLNAPAGKPFPFDLIRILSIDKLVIRGVGEGNRIPDISKLGWKPNLNEIEIWYGNETEEKSFDPSFYPSLRYLTLESKLEEGQGAAKNPFILDLKPLDGLKKIKKLTITGYNFNLKNKLVYTNNSNTEGSELNITGAVKDMDLTNSNIYACKLKGTYLPPEESKVSYKEYLKLPKNKYAEYLNIDVLDLSKNFKKNCNLTFTFTNIKKIIRNEEINQTINLNNRTEGTSLPKNDDVIIRRINYQGDVIPEEKYMHYYAKLKRNSEGKLYFDLNEIVGPENVKNMDFSNSITDSNKDDYNLDLEKGHLILNNGIKGFDGITYTYHNPDFDYGIARDTYLDVNLRYDNQKPAIVLNDNIVDNKISVNQGEKIDFAEYAKVKDFEDAYNGRQLTKEEVSHNVDIWTPGDYEVTYTAKDSSGLESDSVKLTVTVLPVEGAIELRDAKIDAKNNLTKDIADYEEFKHYEEVIAAVDAAYMAIDNVKQIENLSAVVETEKNKIAEVVTKAKKESVYPFKTKIEYSDGSPIRIKKTDKVVKFDKNGNGEKENIDLYFCKLKEGTEKIRLLKNDDTDVLNQKRESLLSGKNEAEYALITEDYKSLYGEDNFIVINRDGKYFGLYFEEITSEEGLKAKAVDKMIVALIGNINVQSGYDIEAVEEAYGKLTQEEQKLVKYYDKVAELKEEYNSLVTFDFGTIEVNEENFPDEKFRNSVKEKYGDQIVYSERITDAAYVQNIIKLEFGTDNYKGFEYIASLINGYKDYDGNDKDSKLYITAPNGKTFPFDSLLGKQLQYLEIRGNGEGNRIPDISALEKVKGIKWLNLYYGNENEEKTLDLCKFPDIEYVLIGSNIPKGSNALKFKLDLKPIKNMENMRNLTIDGEAFELVNPLSITDNKSLKDLELTDIPKLDKMKNCNELKEVHLKSNGNPDQIADIMNLKDLKNLTSLKIIYGKEKTTPEIDLSIFPKLRSLNISSKLDEREAKPYVTEDLRILPEKRFLIDLKKIENNDNLQYLTIDGMGFDLTEPLELNNVSRIEKISCIGAIKDLKLTNCPLLNDIELSGTFIDTETRSGSAAVVVKSPKYVEDITEHEKNKYARYLDINTLDISGCAKDRVDLNLRFTNIKNIISAPGQYFPIDMGDEAASLPRNDIGQTRTGQYFEGVKNQGDYNIEKNYLLDYMHYNTKLKRNSEGKLYIDVAEIVGKENVKNVDFSEYMDANPGKYTWDKENGHFILNNGIDGFKKAEYIYYNPDFEYNSMVPMEERHLHVTLRLENQKPEIVLNDKYTKDNTTTLSVGSTFKPERYAMVSDFEDGIEPRKIKETEATGSVNTKELGEYDVTYVAEDKCGDKSEPVTLKVKIVKGPNPQIVGMRKVQAKENLTKDIPDYEKVKDDSAVKAVVDAGQKALDAAVTIDDVIFTEEEEREKITEAVKLNLALINKAKPVIDKINAIGKVTLDSITDIEEAEKAYRELDKEVQAKVLNYNLLTDARNSYDELARIDKENKEAAGAVETMINNIGEVTLEKEELIKDVRKSYDNLTEIQKELVKNANILTEAENRLKALQHEYQINKAAEAVSQKIKEIGKVTLDSNALIEEARKSYEELSDEAKLKVNNLKDLETAEAEYKMLKEADEKATADAAAVDKLIDSIGQVTLDSKDTIEEARKAYDVLSDQAKAKVKNLENLGKAESEYKVLKETDDKLTAEAASVDELINSIGKVTLDSNALIEEARKSYEELTDEAKAKIKNLEILETAEKTYAELKKEYCKIDSVTLSKAFTKINESTYKYRTRGKHVIAKPVVKNPAGDILVDNRDYEVKYNKASRVVPGKYTIEVKGIGDYTGTVKLTLIITPKAVTNVKVRHGAYNGGYNDAYITWNKSAGAIGYQVYSRRPSKTSKWTYAGKTTKLSMLKKNLYSGYKYEFKVIPYVSYNDVKYRTTGDYKKVSIITLKKINKPVIKKGGPSKVKITWKDIAGESGYQVSTNKAGKISYFRTDNNSLSLKVLKNKKYTYKVRAYRNIKKNGKTIRVYGPWSDVKTYVLK